MGFPSCAASAITNGEPSHNELIATISAAFSSSTAYGLAPTNCRTSLRSCSSHSSCKRWRSGPSPTIRTQKPAVSWRSRAMACRNVAISFWGCRRPTNTTRLALSGTCSSCRTVSTDFCGEGGSETGVITTIFVACPRGSICPTISPDTARTLSAFPGRTRSSRAKTLFLMPSVESTTLCMVTTMGISRRASFAT